MAIPNEVLALEPRVIFEIGCNDGEDTRAMEARWPEAMIHCFEPDVRARSRFHASRAMMWPVALGDRNATVDFHLSDGLPYPLPAAEAEALAAKLPNGWDFSGSVRAPKNHLRHHPWCRFPRTVPVEMWTLDTFTESAWDGPIDLIWADVQGAEGDLVLGGLETFKRVQYFYTEYSDLEMYEGQVKLDQLISMLPGPWEIVKKYQEDVLLRNCEWNGIRSI